MASLSFKDRSFTLTPTWLDNHKQDRPFRVKVKRLSSAELDAFRERAAVVLGKNVATAEELVACFGGAVEGPVGEVEIDGGHVTDFAGLMALAAKESMFLPGSLAPELVGFVASANELASEAAGN